MRPTRALIDLEALRYNYRLARELGGRKALAVVKADAYGHGAVRCARALEAEADGFGVACIEEALELREAGIRAPILLLEGFFEAAELELIDVHDLWTVVQADWQIDAIERARPSRPLTVWLKLDSGMHRLGLAPSQYRACLQRLQTMPQVGEVVAMTHFARADELDCPRTREQAALFTQTVEGLGIDGRPLPTSLGNSPALLGWPEVQGDWARPGLMLYGATPFAAPHPVADRLQPVMTVESQVIAISELPVGEPVGYGARFVTERPTRVGVVAMGYADGYPQFAPNGTPVMIDGRPGQVIGRVSMDMLTVDLTDHPDAGLGSRIELWGRQVRAGDLAARCATSAYRLLCGVKRVPRSVVGDSDA
ncbi:alanine racemase [Lysobacter concretionis Ko07 = DSM 16239]|uniref:Alanine racemase n=1 Tax=Lysobacter concretionis Ko07 = DSM 16239 TaxID=1122185 RepID=A0A0A0EQR6_9GAMM|nr:MULTISPECIES: alanine racemase [Lysobacter]KGM52794.1 alanine racemase [Lysobacter concretionis Ko07 = DSM 16239]QOD91234.1 alanine racemase [Lysobacter sp. CW239]